MVLSEWNHYFLFNFQGKRKFVQKFGEFEKSGIKLQCSSEEREMTCATSYPVVQKTFARDTGIPLYTSVTNLF